MAINSLSASSHGLSGLVSGINSQDFVEKMLAGTQSKIDKGTQKKTILQYKQSMYREVATKLKALQSSYMSFTSKTNLLSNSFFNTMSATIKPPSGTSAAFSVTASSSAAVGNVVMQKIEQLATARTARTQTNASGTVDGVMSQDTAKQLLKKYEGSDATLKIKVGEKEITVKDAPMLFAGKSQSEVAEELNKIFAANDNVAEARFVNNKLEITAANKDEYVVLSSNNKDNALPMHMFGTGNTTLSGKGTLSAEIDTSNYQPSFKVNLDGRQKTISLDLQALKDYADGKAPEAGEDDALTRLTKGLEKELERAFGSGVQVAKSQDASGNDILTFSPGEPTQKFTIEGDYVTMGMFGLKSGISNKLNTSLALRDLNFGTELQGTQQTFSINGVEFAYDTSASLSKILNDINGSKAGVKISYLESEDRFVIQSSETGAGSADFDIKQTSGNLMSVLFGVEGGKNVTGTGVNIEMKGTTAVKNADVADGGTFTFNVNGTNYSFTVTRDATKDKAYTAATLAKELNDSFKTRFGTMADGKQAVELKWNTEDGTYSIITNNKNLEVKAVAEDKKTNTNLLGFEVGQSTRAHDASATLGQAGIVFGDDDKINISIGSGINISIGKDDLLNAEITNVKDITMDRIQQVINEKIAEAMPGATERPKVEFDTKTAAFRIAGVDIPMEIALEAGAGSKNLTDLFGQDSLKVSQAKQQVNVGTNDAPIWQDVLKQTDAGSNAKFTLNGETLERASNTFTVDGLTYTLHSTTHSDPEDTSSSHVGPTTVTVSRDTEQIVEGISEFLKMYNETIDYITGLMKADATYKDYPPLTAAQKKEMSETEIKNWEDKAKEGLLRSDSTLQDILSKLRGAMFNKPEGSSIALYDLGITTSFYTSEGNFNAESFDNLRSAIEKDPEAVRQLFAGEGGIMEQVNNIIDGATRSSSASPGSLVSLAGTSALDTTSTIYKQIKEVDNQLTNLESRYWKEYNRYWKQFNTMEQLIQQMNSQSSWLASSFSS